VAKRKTAESPLGIALLDWMAAHDYNAARLGSEAGLSDQTISRMLYSRYRPRVENLRKLNAVLRWDAGQLETLAGHPAGSEPTEAQAREWWLTIETAMIEGGLPPGLRQHILGILLEWQERHPRSAP